MGRGRAKAKQTKVARDLKYNSPQTDFDRLQRELTGDPSSSLFAPPVQAPVEDEEDDLYDDRWADEVEDDEDE